MVVFGVSVAGQLTGVVIVVVPYFAAYVADAGEQAVGVVVFNASSCVVGDVLDMTGVVGVSEDGLATGCDALDVALGIAV